MNYLRIIAVASALGGVAFLLAVGVFAPAYPFDTALLLLGVFALLGALLLLLFFNLRRHIDLIERQILALHSSIALAQIHLPRPAFFMRHAVSPDFIELVSEIIRRRAVCRALELGCGTSSLYLAALLPQESNGGLLVCLENGAEWARLVQKEIDQMTRPRASVRIVYAPLIVPPGAASEFYDLDMAEMDDNLPFDLLVVDGPSDVSLRKAAFDFLPRFLSPTAVIVLDDGYQPAIRNAVRAWLSASPEWTARYYQTVKGTWVLWNAKSLAELPFP